MMTYYNIVSEILRDKESPILKNYKIHYVGGEPGCWHHEGDIENFFSRRYKSKPIKVAFDVVISPELPFYDDGGIVEDGADVYIRTYLNIKDITLTFKTKDAFDVKEYANIFRDVDFWQKYIKDDYADDIMFEKDKVRYSLYGGIVSEYKEEKDEFIVTYVVDYCNVVY